MRRDNRPIVTVPTARSPDLPHSIGALGLGVAVFNMVVGAGIFILPATLAHEVGAAAPFAYLVCMVAVGAVAICFAAAGSRVPASGGAYGFVQAALGPAGGFLVGALVWVGTVLAAAGIGAALVDGLRPVLPPLAGPFGRTAALFCLYAGLGGVNGLGAAAGTRLTGVLTFAKLLPFAVLLGVGALHVRAANLVVSAPGAQAFGRAVLLAAFAFQGMEGALSVSGEVRRPERNVPLGLLGAMAAVSALYVALQTVVQGVLGPALGEAKQPLAEALQGVSPALVRLMAAGASVSMLGYLAGDTLSAPRTLYAFARDGFLPSVLARTRGRSHAPAAAIAVHVSSAFLLASTGAFMPLAVMSTLAIASVYILGCIAAVVLQRRRTALAGAPLHIRGLELAALVGVGGMGWIASHATHTEAAAGALTLCGCLIWYVIARQARRKLSRSGA